MRSLAQTFRYKRHRKKGASLPPSSMKLLHVAFLVAVSSIASLAAAQESKTDAKWTDWGQQQVLKRDAPKAPKAEQKWLDWGQQQVLKRGASEVPKAEQKWNDYGQQQVLRRMVPRNRRA